MALAKRHHFCAIFGPMGKFQKSSMFLLKNTAFQAE
jgi:hypothetical protein